MNGLNLEMLLRRQGKEVSVKIHCIHFYQVNYSYKLNIYIIQRQRMPPIILTKGDADCVCLYKRRGMAYFRHHFLGGYRCCSSTKPNLRIDLGMKKEVTFTARRI